MTANECHELKLRTKNFQKEVKSIMSVKQNVVIGVLMQAEPKYEHYFLASSVQSWGFVQILHIIGRFFIKCPVSEKN